jgi:phage repressor protein C with HTH and peptisase S24 domain
MLPIYRRGDVIVVSPAARIRKGDRVIVKTKDGKVVVRELRRRTSEAITVRSLNPKAADHTLPTRDVTWLARIVWASQ